VNLAYSPGLLTLEKAGVNASSYVEMSLRRTGSLHKQLGAYTVETGAKIHREFITLCFSERASTQKRGNDVEESRRLEPPSMAESQLSDLRNMRVLLEEARVRSRNLAYHRRAELEAAIGGTLDQVEREIEELRALQG